MSVEGCSFNTDEDIYAFSRELPNTARWNGHTIMIEGESLAYLVKGQQIPKVVHANGMKVAPMESSVEVGGTISWGGGKVEVSGYASGSAKDDSGNEAEVTVEVNGDGSGSATVSVSHDED